MELSQCGPAAVLDSCGDSYLNSHRLIGAVAPIRTLKITGADPSSTLAAIEVAVSAGNAVFFTLSYEFGRRLAGVSSGKDKASPEPDLYASVHDAVVVHDYRSGSTQLLGQAAACERLRSRLAAVLDAKRDFDRADRIAPAARQIKSSFTKKRYLDAIETIQERIRRGDTYQTNLTQQLQIDLSSTGISPQSLFLRLRKESPAAFAAFLTRPGLSVVSASPERFFRIDGDRISASPIKGTRPRSADPDVDARNRSELLESRKDAAENIMIVDLVRNDLGRVCEYGSVRADKICDLETHRTLYHLVSTVTGRLRRDVSLTDVFQALFPCGSITGAPKISTMRIIDELEPHARGLSMGAIGYAAPAGFLGAERVVDTSVAIRTLVIRDGQAEFSVGGGIVIDSMPENEFAETLTKAEALRSALNGRFDF